MYPSLVPTDADVIIIGAGISGMSAAFYLLEHEPSLNILILEAKQRIGGRTLSIPLKIGEGNNRRSFDLGGQFVSTSQLHLMNLLNKLDLRLVKPPGKRGKTVWNLENAKISTTSKYIFDFESLEVEIELRKFFLKINSMSKNVSFSNPCSVLNSDELDSTTMETFIKEHLHSCAAQNFIKHVIRISCGVEPSQISVLFYLSFCKSTGGIENQFLTENGVAKITWIQGGADQICYKIASRIGKEFIKTNQAVIEILRDPYQVTIETETATFLCNYAVIAIPPQEIVSITFKPPLTRSRFDLLHGIKEGHLIKFVATYETAFWRRKGYTGHIISCGNEGGHGPIQGCYDITLKNWPALTGYIASIDCLEQPTATFRTQVLQQLAKYFGNEALNPTDYYEKCWLGEPYIYNCNMNNPGMQNMAKYSEIRHPIGRLFWAGTETATSWNGYMGGAVQAGYRAAIEVLYECRPQSLTPRDIQFVHSRRQRSNFKNALITYATDWRVFIPSTIAVLCVIFYFRKQTH